MIKMIWLAAAVLTPLNLNATNKVSDKDHPPSNQQGYHTINGESLYFKVIGNDGKPPLLMIHGGPGFDHHHMLGMNALAKHYQLIYYDQRGSGNSSGKISTESITMANFVSDLDGIRKSFHIDKADIIATSFGSLIALHYAIQYPQHINSMTLVAAVPASLNYFANVSHTINQRTSKKDKVSLAEIEKSNAFLSNEKEALQKYYRIYFKAYAYEPSDTKKLNLELGKFTAQNMNSVNRLMYQSLGEFNLYPQLAAIHTPSLLLHGDKDPFPYQAVEEMHHQLQNSRFILYKNTGHFLYLEKPRQLFSDIRNFLNRHIAKN